MKKLISVMLCFVMLFATAASAAAAGEAYFEAIGKMNGNYEAEMEISCSLDKPLDILDVLADSIPKTGGYEILGMPSNLKTLVESIFDTASAMDVKVSVSEDYKKMAMEMSGSSVMPLSFGENLKNTTEMTNKMWLEMDFTDLEKPVYRTIQLNPFLGDKYIVTDMASVMGEDISAFSSVMSAVLTEEAFSFIRSKNIELMKEYAKITGSGSSYKIHFDDAGAKAYLMGVLGISFDLIKTMDMGEDMSMLPSSAELAEMSGMLSDIQIFGKDGITYDITMKNGTVSVENMKMSFDLNVYDIISKFAPEELEYSDLFLTKENSDIAFSVNIKAKYKSVNKAVSINFPKLTAENSVDMAELYVSSAVPEPIGDMVFPEYYSVISEGYPINAGGEAYVPVRSLFAAYGVADSDILWDNGVITVKSNGASDKFSEVSFVCGETKVIKDGNVIPLEKAIVNYEGKTCVSGEFIEKVLGGTLTSVYFYAYSYDWNDCYTEYTIEHVTEEIIES